MLAVRALQYFTTYYYYLPSCLVSQPGRSQASSFWMGPLSLLPPFHERCPFLPCPLYLSTSLASHCTRSMKDTVNIIWGEPYKVARNHFHHCIVCVSPSSKKSWQCEISEQVPFPPPLSRCILASAPSLLAQRAHRFDLL